jgi:hypothetical protein
LPDRRAGWNRARLGHGSGGMAEQLEAPAIGRLVAAEAEL